MQNCIRCNQFKSSKEFITHRDEFGNLVFDFPHCRDCTTDSDIANWMQPEITKVMLLLNKPEKVRIIRQCIHDYQINSSRL